VRSVMGHSEAVLVINTQSRRGQRLYTKAKQELERQGIGLAAAYPVRDASRIVTVVEDVIAKGHKFIIVGGGDGTISSVVSLFAHTDLLLGLLPTGTANNFARANRIPLDLKGSVAVLAKGRVKKVDLGHINETYFTNAVSIGVTSAIHRSSPDQMKRYLGRTGYLMVALGRLASYHSFHSRLNLDGAIIEAHALDIRIANGPFHGGLQAVEGASVESGELVVRIIKGPSKWALGHVWMRIALGRRIDPSLVQTHRACQIEISTEPGQFVSVDGEVVTKTPVQVSVAPAALNLLVP
jgi:YegS/Rv2252/BmrU family lipid kinase